MKIAAKQRKHSNTPKFATVDDLYLDRDQLNEHWLVYYAMIVFET